MKLPFIGRRTALPETKSHAQNSGHSGWGFVSLQGGADASWSRRDYASLSRVGYMANPIAHRSVKLVAESIGSLRWLAYEGTAELIEHPLLALLSRPNVRQSGAGFIEMLVGHLMLSGNAYIELVEGGAGARELHLLRPDRVSVVADTAGWPVALDYRAGSAKRRITLPDRALHIALFHPLDDHYGFGPMEAALGALDTHNAASRWNKALLDNSARPSGALVYAPKEGGNLEGEQFDRLKAQLEHEHQGAAAAGRPLLLEGGLDWKPMSLTPKDMDFIDARNAASRDIALALGVPPMLLGIPGDNTYANYQEANRSFWRLTVLPLAARIGGELGNWLGPVFGAQSLRLEADLDQAPGLAAERDALWARINSADFLTDEEKREAVGWGTKE